MSDTRRRKRPAITEREPSVFINCPFDRRYQPLFRAMIFTIYDCGFVARSALETSDSSTTRIEKIIKLIRGCPYGIHDLSRIELSGVSGLPRFNMPLELGIFIGAQRFGSEAQRRKRYLVLDRRNFAYQESTSDISGQDILSHDNQPRKIVRAIRTWLSDIKKGGAIPSAAVIWERYLAFKKELPHYCEPLRLDSRDLTFNDYCKVVSQWLTSNPAFPQKR